METIRNARIIVHLETGKVDLKAPNLDAALKSTEQQVKLTQDLIREQEKLVGIQQQQAAVGGGSGGTGQVSTLEQVLQLQQKIASEREKFMAGDADAYDRMAAAEDRLAASQEKLAQRSQMYFRQAFEGANQAAEGFFRLGRAAVLLGASGDESFQKMIRGLALVQAGFDLFRGTTQIILGIQKALQALAAAQALEAAATGLSTAAHTANTGAMTASTAAALSLAAAKKALAAMTSPVGIALAMIVAVGLVVVDIYDALTTSEEEATESAKRHAEALRLVESGLRKWIELEHEQEARRRSISGGRRSLGGNQSGSFASDAEDAESRGNVFGAMDDVFGAGREQFAEEAFRLYEQSLQLHLKAIEAAKQHRDAEIAISQEKTSQIEAQERIVAASEKQLDIERQKQESFRIQFAMLSDFERDELRRIADKLRAGQDIDEFEEGFISERGGEAGANIANARRGIRGAAAGADAVFDGIADAGSGLKDAEQSFSKATKALEDLAKALTGVSDPAAAKAKLEAERTALEAQYQEFYKKSAEAVERLVLLMEQLDAKIRKLEEGVSQGGL